MAGQASWGAPPTKRSWPFAGSDQTNRVDLHRLDGVQCDPENVARVLRSLARNSSTQASARAIAADVSGSEEAIDHHTVLSYVSALRRLFIIEDLPVWSPALWSRSILRQAHTHHFTGALGLDGTTALYMADTRVPSSDEWPSRASALLEQHGVTAHRGASVSWPTLFNQPVSMVRTWSDEGYLGVDMETAATLSVARLFGVAGVSMLVAWDEVLSDRSFLDPLPADQRAAFDRAKDEICGVALTLISEV